MLTHAADSSEAGTSAAQLPAGRAVVSVNVTLPMTQVQFKQQEVLAYAPLSY
jgi:hypothetical protein